MVNSVGSNIINSVEKILRYLIPGVTFILLFAVSCPGQFDLLFKKISGSETLVLLSILSIGFSIYVIHHSIIHFTFEQIAYWLNISPVNIISGNRCSCVYSKAHAELIIYRNKQCDYPKEYYVYLWAMIHYSFMLSWLLIFFSYCHEKIPMQLFDENIFRIIGVIILSLSICSYLYMQALEKNTTSELRQENVGQKLANKKSNSATN